MISSILWLKKSKKKGLFNYGQDIVMAFSPPVVGCLVKKVLQKGESRAPPDPPLATPMGGADMITYFSVTLESIFTKGTLPRYWQWSSHAACLRFGLKANFCDERLTVLRSLHVLDLEVCLDCENIKISSLVNYWSDGKGKYPLKMSKKNKLYYFFLVTEIQ